MPSLNAVQDVGYWGKTSSTIDWCEENYVVTHYIAEFWNTMSNLMMIVPPFLGVIYGLYQKVEHRMVMCHLSLLAVGMGSWCFHMTLKYSMQLLDELPMIWGSLFILYSVVELEKPLKSDNRWLQMALLVYCFLVTVIYLFNKSPLFFQIAYALMVVAMLFFNFKFTFKYGWKLNLKFQFLSMGSYGLGSFLWIFENGYCSAVRNVRASSPSPLGPITQLHAWWHLLAGFGTYMGILFVFHSRYRINGQRPQIKFLLGIWPYLNIRTPLRPA